MYLTSAVYAMHDIQLPHFWSQGAANERHVSIRNTALDERAVWSDFFGASLKSADLPRFCFLWMINLNGKFNKAMENGQFIHNIDDLSVRNGVVIL